MEGALTEAEAEQYDRQIRLWGLDAQKRLRTSSVLVVGARGLAAELCKNVVLAGVRSLTVLDSEPLGHHDIASRFLGRTDGKNRAELAVQQLQAVNPNVVVVADTGHVKEKDEDYFRQFTAVCVTGCSQRTLVHIDSICRASGVKFFCGDVWGFYGYFFSDLGLHTYAIEVPKVSDNVISVESPAVKEEFPEKGMTTLKKTCSFPSLEDALNVDWATKPPRYFKRTPPTWFIIQILQAFRDATGRDPSSHSDQLMLLQLRTVVVTRHSVASDIIQEDFARFCYSELSPVCAIVGGVLGQEVIKALSGKDEPYYNCFLYDGILGTGIVESLT